MGNSESNQASPSSTPDFNPEYTVEKKIHDAHYGEVKVVKDSKEETEMILKEVNIDTKEGYEKILETYNRRVTVSHPNLVRLIGYTSNSQQGFCSSHYRVNIFIEILGKDLDFELKDRITTRTPFGENEILLVAENLINGLSYYQTQEVAHGDIRPFNIFVTEENAFKLSDPSLAIQQTNALSSAIIGNAKTYLTPKTIKAVPEQDFQVEYDQFKADVYALGMTLLSLATLAQSEELYDYDQGTIDGIMLEQRLELVRNGYSNFTYELIRDMLIEDDEERPDFVALSNRLMPYQDDIRKGLELPFYKSGGFRKVAGGYSGEDALTRASNQLAKSLQMRDGHAHNQHDTGALDDLDARIKAALERSQNTFKMIFGENADNVLKEANNKEREEQKPENAGGREINFESEKKENEGEQEKKSGLAVEYTQEKKEEQAPVESIPEKKEEEAPVENDYSKYLASANEDKQQEEEPKGEEVKPQEQADEESDMGADGKLKPYDNLIKDQPVPDDDSNVVNAFVVNHKD